MAEGNREQGTGNGGEKTICQECGELQAGCRMWFDWNLCPECYAEQHEALVCNRCDGDGEYEGDRCRCCDGTGRREQ